MHRNATFLCERLCAEFPSETNLQLLARCYLQNNQAYRAYHILKGTQMAQCRYLFAIACFQMDLLREAEAALCPPNEPNNEVSSVMISKVNLISLSLSLSLSLYLSICIYVYVCVCVCLTIAFWEWLDQFLHLC
ncbi:Cell division cycle 27-like protein B [Nymphaea thermarum]|nr:Cell division cycle 27-like protein B [Nymphaea thermarum]